MLPKNILVEYACYDEVLSHVVRANVFKALELGLNSISVPVAHMTAIANLIPDGIVLSCPIDFPNGMSDTKIRIHQAVKAHHNGATSIDVVANHVLFRNKRETDFMSDLKALKELADKKDMSIRVFVDHRMTDSGKQLRHLWHLVKSCGIEYIYCSTGHLVEDPYDNLILCKIAEKDYGFSCIANGNLYLPKHLQNAISSEVFGVRFNKIKALENCLVGV